MNDFLNFHGGIIAAFPESLLGKPTYAELLEDFFSKDIQILRETSRILGEIHGAIAKENTENSKRFSGDSLEKMTEARFEENPGAMQIKNLGYF